MHSSGPFHSFHPCRYCHVGVSVYCSTSVLSCLPLVIAQEVRVHSSGRVIIRVHSSGGFIIRVHSSGLPCPPFHSCQYLSLKESRYPLHII
jgi:hypothetical protein